MEVWHYDSPRKWKTFEKENIGGKYLKIAQNFYLLHSGLKQNGLQYVTNLQTRLPDWKTKFVKANKTQHFKIHALYPK